MKRAMDVSLPRMARTGANFQASKKSAEFAEFVILHFEQLENLPLDARRDVFTGMIRNRKGV